MDNYKDGGEVLQESVLRIPKVVFDEGRFLRRGFKSRKPSDANVELQSQVDKIEDGHFRVYLRASVQKENEYEALVQISGYCEVDEEYKGKDVLLRQNAVAILFAYVRSELTLITSQPDTDPIVLPVVNIAAMMKDKDSNSQELNSTIEQT